MATDSNNACYRRQQPACDREDLHNSKSFDQKRISFPADSILNAVIQDGDVIDLLFLLKHNGTEIDLNQTNHSGLTALHHAVLTNNLDMAKLLLNHGADVHVQDTHGLSALHTAAALGLLQMTSFLILFGADVFCHTKQMELPVDLAKDISVIRLLNLEMYCKYHREKYIQSILKLGLATIAKCICDVLIWVLKVQLYVLNTVYNLGCTFHRNRSSKRENSVSCKSVQSTSTDDSYRKAADVLILPDITTSDKKQD